MATYCPQLRQHIVESTPMLPLPDYNEFEREFVADSGLSLSMDVNFGIIEYCQLPAGIFLARVWQGGR